MIGKGTNRKHYILHYMVLAIFMAVSALSFSQTAILKGRVTSEKGEGMEYVSVRLANTPRPIGTITNHSNYNDVLYLKVFCTDIFSGYLQNLHYRLFVVVLTIA